MEAKDLESIVKILKNKKQIVLQGAPGTGKTYVTAELAVTICDGEAPTERNNLMRRYHDLMDQGRIAFTTFHQSMDYEQFVEGFVPQIIQGKGKNVETKMVYSLRDGVFKEICNSASNASIFQKHLTPELVAKFYSDLVCQIKNGEIQALKTKTGETQVTVDSYDGIVTTTEERAKGDKTSLNQIIDFIKTVDTRGKLPLVSEIRSIKNPHTGKGLGGNGSLTWAIMNWMFDELDKLPNNETDSSTSEPYVLIIDEINRGNISKILGELITLLEADKRAGETNCVTVTLPYSNEKFSVPSNLYIIGTMNTADRSVGYIDYAVRRRFAFINVKADKYVIMGHYSDADLKEYVLAVYDKVYDHIKNHSSPEMKPDDIMIGHSYFLAKDREDFDFKLKYEIQPLLDEYFADGIISEKLDIVE